LVDGATFIHKREKVDMAIAETTMNMSDYAATWAGFGKGSLISHEVVPVWDDTLMNMVPWRIVVTEGYQGPNVELVRFHLTTPHGSTANRNTPVVDDNGDVVVMRPGEVSQVRITLRGTPGADMTVKVYMSQGIPMVRIPDTE
jgi:hypothetical protein